jgi:hypothetical protein
VNISLDVWVGRTPVHHKTKGTEVQTLGAIVHDGTQKIIS